MLLLLRFLLLLAVALSIPAGLRAQAFDLSGPELAVTVTRGSEMLPIGRVPALKAGDRVVVEPTLPEQQEIRYLLVGVFLRGATNPPPRDWFVRARTWTRKEKRLELTVPQGAQQMLLFLLPDTGGGYDAVIRAVRGQPGVFVRAAQDLNQASGDRARVEAFLDVVRRVQPESADALSPGLAKSLGIRLDAQCLDRRPELRAACLTRARDPVLLAQRDGSGLAETLAGAPVNLAIQVSNTPAGGYGYYSPYIAVVRDVARLFGAFQTAQLQYVPTLTQPANRAVKLLLNAAPSFRDPRSVMVIAMPAVGASEPPPLRAAEPTRPLCVQAGELLLPVSGAPVIYTGGQAHTMRLRVGGVEVPARADPEQGGFVVASTDLPVQGESEGVLVGRWGFDTFEGPRFRLQSPRPWRLASESAGLVVGRDDAVELAGGSASCVAGISVELDGESRPVEWTAASHDRLTLKVPLARVRPGAVTLVVLHRRADTPQRIVTRALAEASRLDTLLLHQGDGEAVLTGGRLDLIETMSVDGVRFKPGTLTRKAQADQLALLPDGGLPIWEVGQERVARIALSDGRKLSLRFAVRPARPRASLIGISGVRPTETGQLRITLANGKLVSQDARLTFSTRAEGGLRFAGDETVEVATMDGSASAILQPGDGLTLQDANVAVATFEPVQTLGPSARGPLHFRVLKNGTTGAWTPLATLVRLPKLTGLNCPARARGCTLSGERLFLLSAVAADPHFAKKIEVPSGYTDGSLSLPFQAGAVYLRLRDGGEAVAQR
jgi:hypothetical protein